MAIERYRVSTKDNPFNPFTQWDEWYFFDMSQGYNTCERLARLSVTASQLPDEVNEMQIEEAIDQIVEFGAINKRGEFVECIKVENPKFSKKLDKEGT